MVRNLKRNIVCIEKSLKRTGFSTIGHCFLSTHVSEGKRMEGWIQATQTLIFLAKTLKKFYLERFLLQQYI